MKVPSKQRILGPILVKIRNSAKNFSLPGLPHIPILDIFEFYKNGMANGTIGVRAAAISFNFFMAIFPSIIVLFSLIPFIPIPNFQSELISLISQILPSNTYQAVQETIVDITTKKRGSLLSIGLVASLIFSTNGVASMIASLNASANTLETRSFLSTRVIGLFLSFIMFFFISVTTGLIIFNRDIIDFLVEHRIIESGFSQILIVGGKWSIVILTCLLSISTLYHLAPAKRTEYRFLSMGSIMATTLLIIATLLFSFYVSHFGRYNAFFGSIGTLIALLIWFKINAFVLLMGFELDISIKNAGDNINNGLKLSEKAMEYEKYYPKKEDLLDKKHL